MTTTERHPDIEIYLKAQPAEQVEQWLRHRFDAVEPASRTRQGVRYRVQTADTTLPVLVVEKAAGNFTSVWFDSANTPWDNDIACAREAAAHFQCEVRCIASGWNDGDEPDEWWSVSAAGEGKILWRA